MLGPVLGTECRAWEEAPAEHGQLRGQRTALSDEPLPVSSLFVTVVEMLYLLPGLCCASSDKKRWLNRS